MDISRRDFAGIAALALVGGSQIVSPSRAQAATFPAGERRCATCDYWKGQRTLSSDKTSVGVADGATGICGNPQSPLYNRPTRPDQLFNAGYRKWADIA